MLNYPHLRIIPGEDIPARYMHRLRNILRAAAAVRARTGVSTWIDLHAAELCFGYLDGGMPRSVVELPLYRDPCRTVERKITDTDVDDVCLIISRADKVSMTRKERAVEYRRKDREAEAASECEKLGYECAEAVVRETPRTGAIVDGLKEGASTSCRSAAEY